MYSQVVLLIGHNNNNILYRPIQMIYTEHFVMFTHESRSIIEQLIHRL